MRPHKLRLQAAQALIAVALIGAVAVLSPEPALRTTPAAAEELHHVRVIDGDTIDANGQRIRLANIDTPEIGRGARCAAERRLGARATQRARALINAAARIQTDPVGRTDSYGRTVAYVLIDGRDLGEALIAEGLARPWLGRRQPWCDAQSRLIR
jgi:endonuclease YncB( thermonuclease family)